MPQPSKGRIQGRRQTAGRGAILRTLAAVCLCARAPDKVFCVPTHDGQRDFDELKLVQRLRLDGLHIGPGEGALLLRPPRNAQAPVACGLVDGERTGVG